MTLSVRIARSRITERICGSNHRLLRPTLFRKRPDQEQNASIFFFVRNKSASTKTPNNGTRNLSYAVPENDEDEYVNIIHITDDIMKEKPDFKLKKMKDSKKILQTPPPSSPTNIKTQNEKEVSPRQLCYAADHVIPIISTLHIVRPEDDTPRGIWPVYRMMDENGDFRDGQHDGFDSSTYTTKTPNATVVHKGEIEEGFKTKDDQHQSHPLRLWKTSLASQNPHHASTILGSDLFCPSDKPYPDMQDLPPSSSNNQNVERDEMDTHNYKTNTLLRAHRQIIRLREMDTILQNAQRQGRISFYMTCSGEEAIHIGSASALEVQDVVLAQYREAGILMWRGFTLNQFTNQCFTNDLDLGYGRQMPIHYGSRLLNYHTVSSPLGTQLPQAVGVAYKMKLDAKSSSCDKDDSKKAVAIAYFGDGCASTPDFHSACNFAATLQTPTIFFCRNNGYAISTSIKDQYAGDGIISRAPGYGMAGIRVDGNDLFAVHAATKAAREYAIKHSKPVFIEAITYRQGHHSTSDDSTQYRPLEETKEAERSSDPLKRLNSFLQKRNLIDGEDVSHIAEVERMAVLKAMEAAERRPPPKLESMFEDVYQHMPAHLQIQERNLKEHLNKYSDKY